MINKLVQSQRNLVAILISTLSHPILLVAIFIAAAVRRNTNSGHNFLLGTLVGLFLVIGPGLIYSIYHWLKYRQVDIDISQRKDRIVPLLLATLGAFIGTFLLERNLAGHADSLAVLSRILIAMLLSLTIITTVWKISLHTSTFSALATIAVLYSSPLYALLYLSLVPIGWARLELKQHTLKQVVSGSILGALVTYLATIILRA